MNNILFSMNNGTVQGNMKSIILILLFAILITSGCSKNNSDTMIEQRSIHENIDTDEDISTNEGDEESLTTILLTIKNETFQATLYDNDTTKALKARLPLTITMSDLHDNEKYFTFEESLPTQSEQIGSIKNGDLMLFNSDTLVLFYEDFSTSYSYTRLGMVDNIENLSTILGSSNVDVHIELAD